MSEKLTCNLCKQSWDVPEEERLFVMAHHMLMEHPMDIVSHPTVQRKVMGFFESLGGKLADKLRGA